MPGREIAVETCSLLNIYLDYKGSNGSFDFQPARGDNISLAFDFKMDLPAFQELRQIADRVRLLKDYRIRSADMDHQMDSWNA